ncbi:hypothetical protein BIW11_03659 [Tropilaelaps mercedesae]|uniref:Uncharacterized protein n=1 Tax=Tropilaelaps mercedesae TaxID=418985 RepID=A0A1V9XHP2_9ACAR|nr:hypothetical protein BIW11_03659 [Tropilaelaps mercedesae]
MRLLPEKRSPPEVLRLSWRHSRRTAMVAEAPHTNPRAPPRTSAHHRPTFPLSSDFLQQRTPHLRAALLVVSSIVWEDCGQHSRSVVFRCCSCSSPPSFERAVPLNTSILWRIAPRCSRPRLALFPWDGLAGRALQLRVERSRTSDNNEWKSWADTLCVKRELRWRKLLRDGRYLSVGRVVADACHRWTSFRPPTRGRSSPWRFRLSMLISALSTSREHWILPPSSGPSSRNPRHRHLPTTQSPPATNEHRSEGDAGEGDVPHLIDVRGQLSGLGGAAPTGWGAGSRGSDRLTGRDADEDEASGSSSTGVGGGSYGREHAYVHSHRTRRDCGGVLRRSRPQLTTTNAADAERTIPAGPAFTPNISVARVQRSAADAVSQPRRRAPEAGACTSPVTRRSGSTDTNQRTDGPSSSSQRETKIRAQVASMQTFTAEGGQKPAPALLKIDDLTLS